MGQSIGRRRNKTGMNKICCYHHASWSGFTSFRRTSSTGRYWGLTQILPSLTVARYSSTSFHHSFLQNLPNSVGVFFWVSPMYSNLPGHSEVSLIPISTTCPGHLKCTHSLISLKVIIPNSIATRRIKDQLDITCYFISLLMCSTCFGH